jgi:glucose/arabinose dehydrogenase
VARYTLSGNDAAKFDKVLIDNIPSPAGNHNAGDLHFGKDGYLYVSVGDGGCDYANDSGCAGQNDAARDQNVLLGKILRITREGDIPATNPYRGTDSARCNTTGRTGAGKKCQETFAWGLRNPFRMAFDPNASHTRFFINDVGQNAREEIDQGKAGADYGPQRLGRLRIALHAPHTRVQP